MLGTEGLRGQRQCHRGIDDGIPHLIAEAGLRADSFVEEALHEVPAPGFLGGPIGVDRGAEQASVETGGRGRGEFALGPTEPVGGVEEDVEVGQGPCLERGRIPREQPEVGVLRPSRFDEGVPLVIAQVCLGDGGDPRHPAEPALLEQFGALEVRVRLHPVPDRLQCLFDSRRGGAVVPVRRRRGCVVRGFNRGRRLGECGESGADADLEVEERNQLSQRDDVVLVPSCFEQQRQVTGTAVARMEDEKMREFEPGHQLLTESLRRRLGGGEPRPGNVLARQRLGLEVSVRSTSGRFRGGRLVEEFGDCPGRGLVFVSQQIPVELLGPRGTEQARGECGDRITVAEAHALRIGGFEQSLEAQLSILLRLCPVITQAIERIIRRDSGEEVDDIGHLSAPVPLSRRNQGPGPPRWRAVRSTAPRSRSSPEPNALGS